MSLPLPLAAAASLFVEEFSAFDATFTITNGRWAKVTSVDRFIFGVIQTSKEKELIFKSDGVLSDGLLMLHTRDIINIADTSQQTGQNLTQTYVRYGNEIWKLNETAVRWTTKTQGYEKYFMTKYINIDEP